jgi:hypothetical protein
MARIALIDGDEVAYRVALSYQQKYYEVRKDGKLLWKIRYKEDAVESVLNRDDLEITSAIEVLDPKGYQEDVLLTLSSILYKTNSTGFRLYLSGSHNFRYKLATLLPYKGNRSEEKPAHLELVRNYMFERGAEAIDFLEADDMMSANHEILVDQGHTPIICSSDKDLKTVPSLNYNITKKVLQTISEEQALMNFYYQLLIGDGVDNIPSPYGLGETKALSYLTYKYPFDKLKAFYSGFLMSKDKKGAYKTKWYDGRDVDEVLWEVGNLLHMRRTLDPDERWELPSG